MGVCGPCHRAIHGLHAWGTTLIGAVHSLLACNDSGMGLTPLWESYLATKADERKYPMPLKRVPKGATKKRRQSIISANIREIHHGNTFARTKRKHGVKVANKQAVAAAFSAARRRKRRKR